MDMKKAKLHNRLCDVTSLENYASHKDLYDPQYTAIEVDNVLLPIIGRRDERIGIVVGDIVSFCNMPPTDRLEEYSASHVIDFAEAKTMRDVIEKQQYVKSLENEIILNSENIFEPRIDDNDSPEMKGLKEAVICKQIDINAYSQRFGRNYANDKRIFNEDRISLSKLKKIADALDMKATLTLEDKNPNVPNPIGKVITVDITGGNYDDED